MPGLAFFPAILSSISQSDLNILLKNKNFQYAGGIFYE